MPKVLEVLSPWSDLLTAVICVCVVWLLLRKLGVDWSDVTDMWNNTSLAPATQPKTAGFAGSYSSNWMNPNMRATLAA